MFRVGRASSSLLNINSVCERAAWIRPVTSHPPGAALLSISYDEGIIE